MTVADQANAVGDYWKGHPVKPDPPPQPPTAQQQAEYNAKLSKYNSDMNAWESKFPGGEPPTPPEPPSVPAAPAGGGMPAARIGDLCAHGGTVVGPGIPTVKIGGMIAVRGMPAMDTVVCPMFTGLAPHVAGTILTGSTTVMIGNFPAARVSDKVGPPGPICTGNAIAMGCMTVLIGDKAGSGGAGTPTESPGEQYSAQAQTLVAARQEGTPFCEVCAAAAAAAMAKSTPSAPMDPGTQIEKQVQTCDLAKLTIKCAHGERNFQLVLPPDPPKPPPLGGGRVLEVVAGPKGDLIDITTAMDKPYCPKHTQQAIRTSPEQVKAVAAGMSAKASLLAKPDPTLEAQAALRPFSVLWPPSLSRKSYFVVATSCGDEYKAEVVVYPDFDWKVKVNAFSFGDESGKTPGKSGVTSSHGIEASLTYGAVEKKLGVEFERQIQTALSAGQRLRNIMKRGLEFGSKFGASTGLTLPTISIEGTWGYVEKTGQWDVGMRGEIAVALDPLLGWEGKWNILHSVLNLAPQIKLVLAIAEGATSTEIGIWLKVSGTLGGKLSAARTVNDKAWSYDGEISGAIELSLYGGIESTGEDKWIEFSAGGKSGLTATGTPIVDSKGVGFRNGKLERDAVVLFIERSINLIWETKKSSTWELAPKDEWWSQGEPMYFIESTSGA